MVPLISNFTLTIARFNVALHGSYKSHEKRTHSLRASELQATLVSSSLECSLQFCYSYRVCTFLDYLCINAILITYVNFSYTALQK